MLVLTHLRSTVRAVWDSILIANISGTDQAIDKQQTALSTIIVPRSNENIDELRYTNKNVIDAYFDPPKINTSHAA